MAARPVTATVEPPAPVRRPAARDARERSECCALYHHAVELIGKRWSGAILGVLLDGSLRFSEIRALVPDISDRLLSERLKELEGEGLVERHVLGEHPVGVEYRLTPKGNALEPAVQALKSWARTWLPNCGSDRGRGDP